MNPDGVELSKYGIKTTQKKYHNKLLKINGGSEDFSLYKANLNGVDLNNNFNAKWDRQKGITHPAPSGFKGECFDSEIEVKSLISQTKFYMPIFTISLHAKGEEIYYNFYQKRENRIRDKKIACLIKKCTGYKIKNVQSVSSGGYKDWCIQKLKIPAVTIEVGEDSLAHPINDDKTKNIFYKIKDLCYTFCEIKDIVGETNERNIYERGNFACTKSEKKR